MPFRMVKLGILTLCLTTFRIIKACDNHHDVMLIVIIKPCCVIRLSVTILSVIMRSVVMLNVVVPQHRPNLILFRDEKKCKRVQKKSFYKPDENQ